MSFFIALILSPVLFFTVPPWVSLAVLGVMYSVAINHFLVADDPEGFAISMLKVLEEFFIPRGDGTIPTFWGLLIIAVSVCIVGWLAHSPPLEDSVCYGSFPAIPLTAIHRASGFP